MIREWFAENLHRLTFHGRPVKAVLSPQMRQALSCLTVEERRAVIRYLDDQESKRNRTVKAALDKIRVYYLTTIPKTQYSAGTW